jgi:hypothetical protein
LRRALCCLISVWLGACTLEVDSDAPSGQADVLDSPTSEQQSDEATLPVSPVDEHPAARTGLGNVAPAAPWSVLPFKPTPDPWRGESEADPGTEPDPQSPADTSPSTREMADPP